jgi:hypothetical protein
MAHAATTSAGSTVARARLVTAAIARGLRHASPRSVAIAACLLLACTVLLLLAPDLDPSLFIVCGEAYCHPSRLPDVVSVYMGSGGYDGQFYFRLALNPFTRAYEDFGIALDVPAYRQQRILYPLLTWLLSLGGRPALAVWAMIAINVAAGAWLAYLAARYARSCARPAVFGLLLLLFPGFLMTLVRDMSELVEAALLLAGLVSYLDRRQYRAGALLALAVLTRETALLLVGVIGVFELLRFRARRDRAALRGALRTVVPPIVVFTVWQAVLTASWQAVPALAGQRNVGPPLVGVISAARIMAWSTRWEDYMTGAILAAVLCAAVAIAFWSPKVTVPVVRHALLAYAVFAACMSDVVLGEQWSIVRTLAELATLAWMTVMVSSNRTAVVVFATVMPVAWLCTLSQL